MIPISEYMTTDLVVVGEDSPVGETVRLMRTRKVGAVLVRDARGAETGIFTERDFLEKADLQDLARFQACPVREVMTAGLITVSHDAGYSEVLTLMKDKNLRHLPVSRDGDIVGMVSLRDMMRRYDEQVDLVRKDEEEKLKARMAESEKMFQRIFQDASMAMVFTDADDQIASWNQAAVQLLGVADEEIRQQPLWILFPEQERERVRSWRETGDGEHSLDTWVCYRDGSLVDVELSLNPLRDEQGAVSGWILVLHDTRGRTEADQEVASAMARLEALRFGIDEHILVAITDGQGTITYVNDKFCEISGYRREQVLGIHYCSLMPSPSGCKIKDGAKDELAQGRSFREEVAYLRPDGKTFWIETTVVPFLNAARELYQLVFMGTDITQRKTEEERILIEKQDLEANVRALRAIATDNKQSLERLKEDQAQMIQMEKMATLGNLAAGFAHEIKNPLAIVLQGLERVGKMCADLQGNPNYQYLQIVKSAALRADTVVTLILKYSRTAHMEARPMDITEALNDAVQLFQSHAHFNRVQIRKIIPPGAYRVLGDGTMLAQAFFDLFTNAFDAMPEGGEITLEVSMEEPPPRSKAPRRVKVAIRDNGVGIDEEILPRVFEPFFTTKETGKGTGLGLSMVHLIVTQHQGVIHIKSHPGKGTMVTVTLPMDQDVGH